MSATGLDVSRLEKVRPAGKKTVARCPACAESNGDKNGEHLFIAADGKYACVKFQGTDGAEHRKRIFALAGVVEKTEPQEPARPSKLKKSRTWATPEQAARACTPEGATFEAVFEYPLNGKPFAAVGRYRLPDDKTFRQFHANGNGWESGGPSGPWPLFRVEAIPPAGALYIVEGEKCALAAASIGLLVTTSAGGAMAPHKSAWGPLAGREVVIMPDNDPEGETYAANVAQLLGELSPPARVRIARLPLTEPGADIADFLEARDATDPDTLRSEIERLTASVEIIRTGPPSLVELAEQPLDADETLIGAGTCRYLERGAVLMLAAPSGVGKSHLAAQAAVCWSCGRPAFGLPSNGPLRVLILQAENPPNDARAIAAGMVNGLDLSATERASVHANTRQAWLPGCTGEAFLEQAGRILKAWPADMVFIDPLAGFASGDLVRPEIVQAFCRAGLGALAVENRCALFVCHHVPKPNANRDASRMGAYDFQYAGAGSADLVANWPRAVLTLQPLARGEFLLRAAKRRPPWATDDGAQAWEIGLRHTDGGTWETFAVDAQTAHTGRPNAPDPESFRAGVMAVVRETGAMPKSALEERIRAKVTGSRGPARAALALLMADGSLAAWRGPGRGGCTMIGFTNHAPQPATGEA